MTEGKTLPILIKFALPLVAGNVFQLMYTFFDTAATIMVIFGKTILTVFVSPGDADGAQAALWFFRFLSGQRNSLRCSSGMDRCRSGFDPIFHLHIQEDEEIHCLQFKIIFIS